VTTKNTGKYDSISDKKEKKHYVRIKRVKSDSYLTYGQSVKSIFPIVIGLQKRQRKTKKFEVPHIKLMLYSSPLPKRQLTLHFNKEETMFFHPHFFQAKN